jgi:glycosyltransferase involved in cell wall biosynthesis
MNVKPKICLISRFFDLRNGGVGRFSMEIKDGLKKRGQEILPISTNRKGSAGYLWYTAFDLPRAIPKKCDVYHCLTPLEAIYSPKGTTIVTFHDLIPWLHLNKMETHYAQGPLKFAKGMISKYYFQFASKIATKCKLIVCDSEFTRKELLDHIDVDAEKVKVIRLGISRQLKPNYKKDHIFRIGTLSYLDRRKRIDLLIKAFLKANVDGELVIGGSGVDHDRLVEIAGNDKRIKFLGFVPEEKMSDFYNSLNLFVFTTKIEGYGLPIIEAFACNKPVVVMEDSIMPDEIKSKCIVVEDLAEYFKKPVILTNIEENSIFSSLHNWDLCVEQYIELYKYIGNK